MLIRLSVDGQFGILSFAVEPSSLVHSTSIQRGSLASRKTSVPSRKEPLGRTAPRSVLAFSLAS
jgi:hypothetical protein